jgi:hypothetical protein
MLKSLKAILEAIKGKKTETVAEIPSFLLGWTIKAGS